MHLVLCKCGTHCIHPRSRRASAPCALQQLQRTHCTRRLLPLRSCCGRAVATFLTSHCRRRCRHPSMQLPALHCGRLGRRDEGLRSQGRQGVRLPVVFILPPGSAWPCLPQHCKQCSPPVPGGIKPTGTASIIGTLALFAPPPTHTPWQVSPNINWNDYDLFIYEYLYGKLRS